MELSKPEVTALATQMRTLFSKRKQRQYPKYRLNERTRRPEFWEKSALVCREMGAHPRDWVEAAFVFNTAPGGPYPQTMHGKAIKRWYREYMEKDPAGNRVGDIPSRVKFDFEVLADCIQRNNSKPIELQKTLEQLLIDPLNKIQPYVAVVAYPKSYVVRLKYLDRARKMIDGSVAYLDAIHDLGFKTKILTDASITAFSDLSDY